MANAICQWGGVNTYNQAKYNKKRLNHKSYYTSNNNQICQKHNCIFIKTNKFKQQIKKQKKSCILHGKRFWVLETLLLPIIQFRSELKYHYHQMVEVAPILRTTQTQKEEYKTWKLKNSLERCKLTPDNTEISKLKLKLKLTPKPVLFRASYLESETSYSQNKE